VAVEVGVEETIKVVITGTAVWLGVEVEEGVETALTGTAVKVDVGGAA